MNKLTLYFSFLITSVLSPNLQAQHSYVKNIDWDIAGTIPPGPQQTRSVGLAGAIVGVNHQVLMVAGGNNFPAEMPWNGGKKQYYAAVFLYRKTPGGLQLIPETHCKLPFNLAYSGVASTTHGVVVAGGENEDGLSKKVLLLNWKNEALEVSYLPELPEAVSNASLTVTGDLVYLAGGEAADNVSRQFLLLNLKALQDGWKKLPELPKPVSHTVLLASDHASGADVLLIGGRMRNSGDTSTLYKEVFAFNLQRNNWTAKAPLPYPLSAAAGVIKGRNILVFSGDQGETFHKAEKLIAEIARENDADTKEALNQQKIELQSNHPGFSTATLKYNLVKNSWTVLNNPMPYGTVTTSAVSIDNEVIIVGGEIKAGVRTPNILIGKLNETK